MKILLLAGTGAIGKYLSKILVEEGHIVYITTRKDRASEKNLFYLKGNAHDLVFLKTILSQNFDCIVDFLAYEFCEFDERIDVLLNATRHYLFISSARVYANSITPIKENSSRLLDIIKDEEFLKTSEYSLTKAKEENILIKSSYNNWTIIRPYITYGDGRFQLGTMEKEKWLYLAKNKRPIYIYKKIYESTTTLTSGKDVAKGISVLVGNKDAYRECFHITSDKSYKWKDIVKLYFDTFEAKYNYRPDMVITNTPIVINDMSYQAIYDRCLDRKFDNSKIKQYLKNYEFYDIDELACCFYNFLNEEQTIDVDYSYLGQIDKIAKKNFNLFKIHGFKGKLKYLLYRYCKSLPKNKK